MLMNTWLLILDYHIFGKYKWFIVCECVYAYYILKYSFFLVKDIK